MYLGPLLFFVLIYYWWELNLQLPAYEARSFWWPQGYRGSFRILSSKSNLLVIKVLNLFPSYLFCVITSRPIVIVNCDSNVLLDCKMSLCLYKNVPAGYTHRFSAQVSKVSSGFSQVGGWTIIHIAFCTEKWTTFTAGIAVHPESKQAYCASSWKINSFITF